jgi:hypothetical protein
VVVVDHVDAFLMHVDFEKEESANVQIHIVELHNQAMEEIDYYQSI